jgi:hypothetical protein
MTPSSEAEVGLPNEEVCAWGCGRAGLGDPGEAQLPGW